MGIIKINNIKVFSNHGCLEEEEKIGSEYRVDIEIEADLSISAESDDLADTVNYVQLNTIAVEEMSIRSKLLEHVTKRIISRIFKEIPMITRAKVAVAKINPPIGGNIQEVAVILEETR